MTKQTGPTALGIVHKDDPEEALKILRKAFKDGEGDEVKIAAILGVSRYSVRRYRYLHEELGKIAKKARVEAARAKLGERQAK